ncbi:MAG: DUF6599 family protein [Granulicella sp.]
MGALPRRTTVSRSLAGLCLAAAISIALPASAQTMLVGPPLPLLPQHIGLWQMHDQATLSTDPDQADAPHAAQLKEDGFTRSATAHYQRGPASLDVKVLQFIDATGASAAWSYYRAITPTLRPLTIKLGAESAASESEVLFRAENSIVIATGSRVAPSELQPIAVGIPKVGGAKGMSPLLPTLLPEKGLEPTTIRYALGPASYAASGGFLPAEMLGFDKAAEAVTANYTGRPGKGVLTLLLYPTPQIAGNHGRDITAWLNAHPDGLGTIKLRREGPLVLLITGSFPPEEAQHILENIHLRPQVTWDKKLEPEFHAEVQKTASLLTSILVLSGLLMLAAIFMALFFGFGRATIRVMRGKPAASEPEFLALGLARGPVKAISRKDNPAIK